MAIVKGSKQETLKVVKARPWLPVVLILLVISAIVVSSSLAYFSGLSKGGENKAYLESTLTEVSQALEVVSAQRALLEQNLANATLGANIDRQSSEDVRQEIASLSAKLAKLEADNRFYKNLMAPTKNKRGLSFGAIEIADTQDERRFTFKIVVQQLSTNHNTVSGTLAVRVSGVQNDLPTTFSLSELSSDISQENIKLRFKYFQSIEGSLILPEGFNAKGIDLKIQAKGKNAVEVEKRLGWLVEKR